MTSRVLAITGRPGIGKTSLVLAIAEKARSLGCRVGGVVTPEVRDASGLRWGFRVRDLGTGLEHILASVSSTGPRVGSYRLEVGADEFLSSAIERALSESDLLIIDEIGPMELSLSSFRALVIKLLGRPPLPTAVTFHYRLRSSEPSIYILLMRGKVIELTEFNRGSVRSSVDDLTRWLIDEACDDKRGEGAPLHT
ncbi:MAG: nucleoside-triphosphatase [Acidilobus sp.]